MMKLSEFRNRQLLIEAAILKINVLTESHILNLRSANSVFGIEAIFKQNDIRLAKKYFFNCALLDEYIIKKFQSRFFDYALPQMNYTILSDNWTFMAEVYSSLNYNTFYLDDKTQEKIPLSMVDMVSSGESAIWCNTVQMFMANDFEGVERNLNIIKTLTFPRLSKQEELLKIDYEFYKALLTKDKSKCEEVLEELVSPKIHKKRNDSPVLKEYVTQPALGYAKLAWCLGVEVEVNNPLVPKEILPIEPLDSYDVPYDFLRADNNL